MPLVMSSTWNLLFITIQAIGTLCNSRFIPSDSVATRLQNHARINVLSQRKRFVSSSRCHLQTNTQFHFFKFERKITMPSKTNDFLGVLRICSFQVETIQVRCVTNTVPPSSVIACGAVVTALVIVVFFSRKGHPIVPSQYIACVSTI